MKNLFVFLLLVASVSRLSADTTTINFTITNPKTIAAAIMRNGASIAHTSDNVPYKKGDILIFTLSNPNKNKFTYTIQTNTPIPYTQENILVSSANDPRLKNICDTGKTLTIKFIFDKSEPIKFKYHLGGPGPAGNDVLPGDNTSPPPTGTDKKSKALAHYTGIAYYDALALLDSSNITRNEWRNILCNYFGMSSFDSTIMTSHLNSNPFLKRLKRIADLPDSEFVAPIVTKKGLQGGAFTSSSILSSVGNLNVTNIADGIAQFMVERAKGELGEVFFSKLDTLLNKPEYKDERTLFPNTYATLSLISNQIYNYSNYLNSLRTSFEKDLGSLLTNMPKVITDPAHKAFFDKQPVLKAVCLSSLYFGNCFLNKTQPGQMIAEYDTTFLTSIQHYENIVGGVKTIQLVSSSLKSKGNTNYWLSGDSIKLLLNNVHDYAFLQIYLGLLCEQSNHIIFETDTTNKVFKSLKTILIENYSPANNTYVYFKNVIKQVSVIQNNVSNIAGIDRNNLTFTDYYNYYNSALDMIDTASTFYRLPGLGSLKNLCIGAQKYLNIAKQGGNIAFDISSKNYGSAIASTATIFGFAFGDGLKDSYKGYETPEKNIKKDAKIIKKQFAVINDSASSTSDKTTAKKALKKAQDDSTIASEAKNVFNNAPTIKNFLMKYGTFIATVAEAKDAGDVKSAMESAVLPSGSSSIKQHSYWTVMVDSYIGGLKAWSNPGTTKGSKNQSLAVTAPIGISLSYGFNCRSIGTASLFFSVVDIGAFAAFRLDNDSTQSLPKTTLANILAPGIHLELGRLLNSPLSISGGYQMSPQLRSLTATNAEVSTSNQWQWQAAVTWNIPFFNLYTDPRN